MNKPRIKKKLLKQPWNGKLEYYWICEQGFYICCGHTPEEAYMTYKKEYMSYKKRCISPWLKRLINWFKK